MKEVPLDLDTLKTRIYQYIEIEENLFSKRTMLQLSFVLSGTVLASFIMM